MKSFFWTDSNIVLSWISNNQPYKQYVSSRIKEICQSTSKEDWRHCPGSLNPADVPSRGLRRYELPRKKTWWEGPQFLQLRESEWPSVSTTEPNKEADSELLKNPPDVAHVFSSSTMQSNYSLISLFKVIDIKRFSNLDTLL